MAAVTRMSRDTAARQIHFSCQQCGDRLHLTSYPAAATDFTLVCPCCRRKGRYNLHTMLDDALEDATQTPSLDELNAALYLGADVDLRMTERGALDLTPIGFAVSHRPVGMHAMVRRFVDARADLDTTDANDRTLVINAVMHNDMKLLAMLLDRSASPMLPSECTRRISPLHAVFLTKRQYPNLEILDTLVNLGCLPHAQDAHGNDVLRYAVHRGDDISLSLVMRALNWHLHAPDSLKPRRPVVSSMCNNDIRVALTPSDLSAPPSSPPPQSHLRQCADARPAGNESTGAALLGGEALCPLEPPPACRDTPTVVSPAVRRAQQRDTAPMDLASPRGATKAASGSPLGAVRVSPAAPTFVSPASPSARAKRPPLSIDGPGDGPDCPSTKDDQTPPRETQRPSEASAAVTRPPCTPPRKRHDSRGGASASSPPSVRSASSNGDQAM